jgi:DNA-binding response OmpR family regulator
VDVAQDGQMGWEYTQNASYDLLLIDVGLPKLDGITLCQRLRSGGCFTPILLMTAKDGTQERIQGLDAGADDYLIKPLDLGELQARIRALLRRGDRPVTSILEVGALRLDPSSCEVTYNNTLLELTAKEYSLLELFLRNPSRVFSRGDIIEHLWTFDDPPQEETVKSHIKYLRQKLKAAGALILIDSNLQLGSQLQQLVECMGMCWQQITNLEDAKNFLQTTSPDLVVINVDEVGRRQESLALLSELATRNPPVPVLVLAGNDELVERVTFAQCGARGRRDAETFE